MCLITKNKHAPSIATEPIKCYKVVLVFTYQSDKIQIFSPFYRCQYTLNRVTCTEIFVDHSFSANFSVVFEGFHSFVHKKDAIKFAEEVKRKNEYIQKGFYDCKVTECIIPANSKYYTGTFSVTKGNGNLNATIKNLPAYASNKLMVQTLL